VNTVSHAEKASESSLPTPVLTKLRPDTASKRHGVCSFFALPAFNKGPQRLRNQAVAELRGTSRVWIRTWRQERALPSGPLNWRAAETPPFVRCATCRQVECIERSIRVLLRWQWPWGRLWGCHT